MHERLGGTGDIIGVNVSEVPERFAYYDYGTSLSGWRVLLSRLNPFRPSIRNPRIAETLLRSTDIKGIDRLNQTREMLEVLVEPDVGAIAPARLQGLREHRRDRLRRGAPGVRPTRPVRGRRRRARREGAERHPRSTGRYRAPGSARQTREPTPRRLRQREGGAGTGGLPRPRAGERRGA